MQLNRILWVPLSLVLHACDGPHPTDGPIDAYLEYEAGDFDGDQRTDLVLVFPYYHPSFPPDQILFNDDPGWMSRELWAGNSVTVGDFDGDGVDDVARFTEPHSLRNPAPLRVWMGGQHRDLSLAVEPQASRATVACARRGADYLTEHAGEELLCTSYDPVTYVYDYHVVVIGESIEVFPPGISPANDLNQQASGDFDGDGAVDVVFTGRRPEGAALWLFRNLGGGEFDIAGQYEQGWAHHVSLGEFDGAPGLEIVYIQLGNGNPKLPRGEPARLHWAAWDAGNLVDRGNFELPDDSYWMDQGDIDLDGRDEILALHPTGVVRVDFDGPTPTMVELDLPRSILMDADGDGDLDYVRYDEDLEQIIVLHNDGTGTFTTL